MKKSEYFILFMVFLSVLMISLVATRMINTDFITKQQTDSVVSTEASDKPEGQADQNATTTDQTSGETENKKSGVFERIGSILEDIFNDKAESTEHLDSEATTRTTYEEFSPTSVMDKFKALNNQDSEEHKYVVEYKGDVFRMDIVRWYNSNGFSILNFMVITEEGIDIKYRTYCGEDGYLLSESNVKRFGDHNFAHDLSSHSFYGCDEELMEIVVYNWDETEILYETLVERNNQN